MKTVHDIERAPEAARAPPPAPPTEKTPLLTPQEEKPQEKTPPKQSSSLRRMLCRRLPRWFWFVSAIVFVLGFSGTSFSYITDADYSVDYIDVQKVNSFLAAKTNESVSFSSFCGEDNSKCDPLGVMDCTAKYPRPECIDSMFFAYNGCVIPFSSISNTTEGITSVFTFKGWSYNSVDFVKVIGYTNTQKYLYIRDWKVYIICTMIALSLFLAMKLIYEYMKRYHKPMNS